MIIHAKNVYLNLARWLGGVVVRTSDLGLSFISEIGDRLSRVNYLAIYLHPGQLSLASLIISLN